MLPLYIKSPNSYLSQGNFTKPFIDQKPTKLLKNLQLHKERNQVSLFLPQEKDFFKATGIYYLKCTQRDIGMVEEKRSGRLCTPK